MEVEIRAKCEHEKVLKELENMGFEFGESKVQDDSYYKRKGEEKAPQGPGSWIVRIRKEGERTEFGMKVLTETAGSWEEFDTVVSDGESVATILDRIGLAKIMEINKTRMEAKKGEISVCIDDVKQLGTFIEAEVITDNVEEGKKKISELFNAIGIHEDDYEHRGYAVIISTEQGVKFNGTG